MTDKTKHKLRTLLLSAAASLLNTTAQADEAKIATVADDLDNDILGFSERNWGKVFKNVAKVDANGNVRYVAGHRSHMSHRSGGGGGGGHYSHYSHYGTGRSGGGSSHRSHYSSRSGSSSSSRSSSSTSGVSSHVYTPRQKTPDEYSLGDRKITVGVYGSDVTSLLSYLANDYYYDRRNTKEKNGYTLYDSKMADAVKHFQKDAGLKETGVADETTISRLRSWDKSMTSVELGMRNLSFSPSETTEGVDVTELVTLLTKAGFAPNPSKIIINNGKTQFTKDISIAVRLFQAYNHLTANGIADEETIVKLKTFK